MIFERRRACVTPPISPGYALGMELVTENQHRILAFIGACNHAGYAPTDEEVTAWLDAPAPREAVYKTERLTPTSRTPAVLDGLFGEYKPFSSPALGNLFKSSWVGTGPWFPHLDNPRSVRKLVRSAETPIDHMVRILWLSRSKNDRLEVARLGRAMLQTVENEVANLEDPTVLYLSSDDPLAYPLLVGALSEADSGLLVDPWLKAEHVVTLHEHTTINRLLVGRGDRHRSANAAISLYLDSTEKGEEVEVRMSDELHDRLLITQDGAVSMLGTSLNGVGRKTTILLSVPQLAAGQLHDHYERLWQEAEVLYPRNDTTEDSSDKEVIIGEP